MATKSDMTKKAPGKRGRPPKPVLNDKPDIDQLRELYHQMMLIPSV